MYVMVPLMEKLVASSSLTNNFLFIVTLPPTVKFEFIETSLLRTEAPLTYNFELKDTSEVTNNLLLKDASPFRYKLEFMETSFEKLLFPVHGLFAANNVVPLV